LSGKDLSVLQNFFAYDAAFRGGVYVAAGDVTGAGHADLIVGAGVGGGPRVEVFDGGTLAVLQDFFAYAADFGGGVAVGVATLPNGRAALLTGAAAGGGPQTNLFDGVSMAGLESFFAFDAHFRGGVFVGGM
jgi:hypothetical protein